jgi:hypothetical protein
MTQGKVSGDGEPCASHISVVQVGRQNLSDALPPHNDYEGRHRFDPGATWTVAEERRVVLKTDLYLLSWICVMVWTIQNFVYLHRTDHNSLLGFNLIVEIYQMQQQIIFLTI